MNPVRTEGAPGGVGRTPRGVAPGVGVLPGVAVGVTVFAFVASAPGLDGEREGVRLSGAWGAGDRTAKKWPAKRTAIKATHEAMANR